MSLFFVLGALCHLPAAVHGQSLRGTLHNSAADLEGTATVFDPANESWAVQNLISCRYGVLCHGTEIWRNGQSTCEGSLACRTEGTEASSGGNGVSEMQDNSNSTTAVANLLVCRYGSYCRGGWWYHYGRRECRGGIVCRPGPYYASSESSEPTLPSIKGEDINSEDSPQVAMSPLEPTYDPVNQSHGFSNLISCRFGVVCRGTWLWINGVRKCSGALVCKSGYKEIMNVESEVVAADVDSNFTTMMQDNSNSTTAVANLLVCRYGSYCRGGWWYHYGRRECRGGIVCRPGPYYASSESSEPTLPSIKVEARNSEDSAQVAMSPLEPTYDPVNQSHGFSNLISCRFGVVCRGTWLWINGVRKCSGALVCKSGYKEIMNVESAVVAADVESNFTTIMQDNSNSTTAVANLLVCRYGSYCRGGWWYHYGRRECRGGIVCRPGP